MKNRIYLTSQKPPHKANAVRGFVVSGDGDIDKPQRRVSVAKSDDGNVNIRSFRDGLMVESGIGNDQETGLSESCLDLIGERTYKQIFINIRVVGSLKISQFFLEFKSVIVAKSPTVIGSLVVSSFYQHKFESEDI